MDLTFIRLNSTSIYTNVVRLGRPFFKGDTINYSIIFGTQNVTSRAGGHLAQRENTVFVNFYAIEPSFKPALCQDFLGAEFISIMRKLKSSS